MKLLREDGYIAMDRYGTVTLLEKGAEIERHIEELQSMRDQLLALANACPGDGSADCPIIENLSGCCHHRAG